MSKLQKKNFGAGYNQAFFSHSLSFLIERPQRVLASLWIFGPKSKHERRGKAVFQTGSG